MYYTVYKITNKINDKIYVGVHKTTDLDDGYMGSGVHLKRSQELYGIENFEKEIIAVFDNQEDMFMMESEIVNEEFVSREDTYNLKVGGFGGFDYVNSQLSDKSNRFDWYKEKLKDDNFRKLDSKIKSVRVSINNRLGISGKRFTGYEFLGKFHTEETKKLIGAKNSISQSGEGNSQFGTMWIHNLELQENKKIKKEEFPNWEQDGWLKGRKMKYLGT